MCTYLNWTKNLRNEDIDLFGTLMTSSKTVIKEINQVTRGWIGYFGLGFIRNFIKSIEQWLHHRIRQLILKRWKKSQTKITKVFKYGLDIDSARRIGYSRKKYWRLSNTPEVHRALTTKRLYQWSLVPLVESAYARY